MKYNLDNLVLELENLEKEMSNPDIFKDQKKVREVSARKKMIEKAVDIYKIYKSANESLEENKEMLNTEKDEEMRESYETTLKDNKNNAVAFLKNISRKEVERKRSVTFSITESQLKKMDTAARKNGFKNRSEFLASIIDAI